MPIYAPAKRINPTVKRKGALGKKEVYAGLYLTSMVDMFAIMVIFLLQSFSAEGELIVLPSGLELPKAENVGTLEKAPSLIIAKDVITLENVVVGSTLDLFNQEDWHLESLQTALKDYRLKLEEEELKKTPENPELAKEEAEKPTQKINISADRRLPFQVIRKVIYNAGRAGYPDFRFAVFAGNAQSVSEPIEWMMPVPNATTPQK